MLRYFAPGLFWLLVIFVIIFILLSLAKYLIFKIYENKLKKAMEQSYKEIIDFERKE